jgi:hypothetical protein
MIDALDGAPGHFHPRGLAVTDDFVQLTRFSIDTSMPDAG